MTRTVCCLALSCLVVACAPKKAILVEEAPTTPPVAGPPAPAPADVPDADPRIVQQESGMVVPDLTRRLPDRRDMTPTAAPETAGGPVIVTPPRSAKPVNE